MILHFTADNCQNRNGGFECIPALIFISKRHILEYQNNQRAGISFIKRIQAV